MVVNGQCHGQSLTNYPSRVVVNCPPLRGAFTPATRTHSSHLSVGDDVEASALLIVNGDECGVVLRLFKEFRSDAPEFLHAHPRGKAAYAEEDIRNRVYWTRFELTRGEWIAVPANVVIKDSNRNGAPVTHGQAG